MKGMLPPSDLPEPPKIGSIPTGPSADAEWAEFIAACKTAFAAVKVAKDALRHQVNQETAAPFGADINVAWNRMQAARKEVEK